MQGQLELRKPQNLTVTRQYGKTLRVEFTLTKLQEDVQEQKLETNSSGSQNFNKTNGNKIFELQTHSARQINMPRLCKSRLN